MYRLISFSGSSASKNKSCAITTFEKIELDTERDYFMSAEETKTYGLIDEVISRSPEQGKTDSKATDGTSS